MCLLKLVNKENHLEDNYIPKDLVQDAATGIWLRETALRAFWKLNEGLVTDGIRPLVLISGYRPYTYQKMLYDKKINFFLSRGLSEDEAVKCAGEIVAMPGCSEHQLGLAIDITASDMKDLSDPLIQNFEETLEGRWLTQNSSEYGFVLRYPKDKTEITHIAYEPWHYRYLGEEHAIIMNQLDMCLEEYVHSISY